MLIDYKKEIMIDHRSAVKAFDQIYSQLEELLSSGKILHGQPLLSINDLANVLDVDVHLIQDIYQKLEKSEYIFFDDFGLPRVTKYNRILDFFNRFIAVDDGIRAAGKSAAVDILGIEIIELTDETLVDLSKYKDKRFCKQARLYKANDKPYVYLEEFFPADRFPALLEIDHIKPRNIYNEMIHPMYKVQLKKIERVVRVEEIDATVAKILSIKAGLNHFTASMIYYDQDDMIYGYANVYALPYHYFEYNTKII